jgi:hypothetical protein
MRDKEALLKMKLELNKENSSLIQNQKKKEDQHEERKE